jgi:LmbE family N-acetylglucosaminyl deacetylase
MACFGLREDGSRRIAVISPHLDDAVLSLGASIFEAARDGHRVAVVTVFAGDPESGNPAGRWDMRTGFETAGEAVRCRREEDRQACALLGAEPVWLPFADGDYGGERSSEEIAARLVDVLAPFDAALVPGRPLKHADHLWLARCVDEHGVGPAQLGLYAELPYDLWAKQDRGTEAPIAHDSIVWRAPRVTFRARLVKWRACGAYSSQLRWLGRGRFRTALLRARVGSERTAWPE